MTPAEVAADLTQRIAAGDREAETRLVECYSRGVVYLLRRLTGDPALSDDLHQETFRIVVAKARAGELREAEKLGGFIRSTAKNLWIAEYRKAARRPRNADVDSAPEPTDPAPSALHRLVQQEDRRHLRRVLRKLDSERDRQLLFRFYLAEEPKDEICAALGVNHQHFKVVLFRARQRFKRQLERSSLEPPGR